MRRRSAPVPAASRRRGAAGAARLVDWRDRRLRLGGDGRRRAPTATGSGAGGGGGAAATGGGISTGRPARLDLGLELGVARRRGGAGGRTVLIRRGGGSAAPPAWPARGAAPFFAGRARPS